MGRLWLLSLLLGLLHIGFAAKCPRQRNSPGKEILCYTESYNIQRLEDVICSCTVLVHQGHDIQNLPDTGFKDLRNSLKEKKHDLRFILAVNDERGFLKTSGLMRQEAATRLATILTEVDGVELNVTAGSKERLVHFVKGLKDEMIRKSNEKVIFLALPAKPELLAKQFDIKELSKYVDFFTTSTHYLVDEEEAFYTFHPSRLMGLFDMLNTDSVIDLIIGLGAPKSKIIMSVPVSAYKFALKDEKENTPRSPTNNKQPTTLDRKQLCDLMSVDEWTLERDDDLTAPYAFKNKDWIAFEDRTSIGIKGKYVSLRDLAGLGIRDIENDRKNNCSKPITQEIFQSFTNLKRKTRQAVLSSLENELHTTQLSYPSHVKPSGYRISRVVDTKGHIHAIREHSHTEFSCTRQGYFVHPKSCNRFYRCVKFNQEIDDYSVFEFDCPAGLAFDERTEVCVWPGSLSKGSPCPGSSEIAPVPKTRFECPDHPGYYADPQNCRWFFACFDLGGPHMIPYEFRCPFGLVFDEDKLICEWPWLVPKCGGGGYTYTHFGGYGGHDDYGGHSDYDSHEDHGGHGDYGGHEDHGGHGDYGGHDDHGGNEGHGGNGNNGGHEGSYGGMGDYGGLGSYGGNGDYDGYGGHHVSPVSPGGSYGMIDHGHGGHGGSGDNGVKGGHGGYGGFGGHGGSGGHKGNGGNGGYGGSGGHDGHSGSGGHKGHDGNGGYGGHGGSGGHKGQDGNGGHGGHGGSGGYDGHGGSGGHNGHGGNGGHKGYDGNGRHGGSGGHKGHDGNGGHKGHNGSGGNKGHGGHDGGNGGHDDHGKDDSEEHYGGHDTSPVFPGKGHGTKDDGHDKHGGKDDGHDKHGGKDDGYDHGGKDDDHDTHGGKDDDYDKDEKHSGEHGGYDVHENGKDDDHKDKDDGYDDHNKHDDKDDGHGYDHHTTTDHHHHTTTDHDHHTTTDYNHHTTDYDHHTTDYDHHTTTEYNHHTTTEYNHHTTTEYNHHTTTDHDHHTTTDYYHPTTDYDHYTTVGYDSKEKDDKSEHDDHDATVGLEFGSEEHTTKAMEHDESGESLGDYSHVGNYDYIESSKKNASSDFRKHATSGKINSGSSGPPGRKQIGTGSHRVAVSPEGGNRGSDYSGRHGSQYANKNPQYTGHPNVKVENIASDDSTRGYSNKAVYSGTTRYPGPGDSSSGSRLNSGDSTPRPEFISEGSSGGSGYLANAGYTGKIKGVTRPVTPAYSSSTSAGAAYSTASGGNSYTDQTGTGYTRSRDEGYTGSRDEGYIESRDKGYTGSRDKGYTGTRDKGYSTGPSFSEAQQGFSTSGKVNLDNNKYSTSSGSQSDYSNTRQQTGDDRFQSTIHGATKDVSAGFNQPTVDYSTGGYGSRIPADSVGIGSTSFTGPTPTTIYNQAGYKTISNSHPQVHITSANGVTSSQFEGPAGGKIAGSFVSPPASSSGSFYAPENSDGKIVTGINQPEYVNANTGLGYSNPNRYSNNVFLTGQSQNGAQTTPNYYLSRQTSPGGVALSENIQPEIHPGNSVTVGPPITTYRGPNLFTADHRIANPIITTYRGSTSSKTIPVGPQTTPVYDNRENSGYKINEYHDNGGRGTIRYNNGFIVTKIPESDYRNFQPSLSTLPDSEVSGGRLDNSGGTISGASTYPQQFSGAGVFTPEGFTKTGPTRTGITTAQLGGSGSYVIGTSPRPRPNLNNIGENAFAGNVGYNNPVISGSTPGSGSYTTQPSGSFSGSTAPYQDATTLAPLLNADLYNTNQPILSSAVTNRPYEPIKSVTSGTFEPIRSSAVTDRPADFSSDIKSIGSGQYRPITSSAVTDRPNGTYEPIKSSAVTDRPTGSYSDVRYTGTGQYQPNKSAAVTNRPIGTFEPIRSSAVTDTPTGIYSDVKSIGTGQQSPGNSNYQAGEQSVDVNEYRGFGSQSFGTSDYRQPGYQPSATSDYKKPGYQSSVTSDYSKPGYQPSATTDYRKPGYQSPITSDYSKPGYQPSATNDYKRPDYQSVTNNYNRPSYPSDKFKEVDFQSTSGSFTNSDQTSTGYQSSIYQSGDNKQTDFRSDYQSPIIPVGYTTGPKESFQTTIYQAAKIPGGTSVQPIVDDGYKTIVSPTKIPVIVTPARYDNQNPISTEKPSQYQTNDYSQVTSDNDRGIFGHKVTQPNMAVSLSSQAEKGQIYRGSSSTSTTSDYTVSKNDDNRNYVTSTDYDRETVTDAQVVYIPSTTISPESGVTYRRPFTTQFPIPSNSQDSRDEFVTEYIGFTTPSYSSEKGYSTVGKKLAGSDAITTAVGGTRFDFNDKQINENQNRGSVKFTPNSAYIDEMKTKYLGTSKPISSVEGQNQYTTDITPSINTYHGNYRKIYSTTPEYKEEEDKSISAETTNGRGRKIIVKLTDLHPILLGKLGAECTCKSDPFDIFRGPRRKHISIPSSRGIVDLANYDESDVYVDLEADKAIERIKAEASIGEIKAEKQISQESDEKLEKLEATTPCSQDLPKYNGPIIRVYDHHQVKPARLTELEEDSSPTSGRPVNEARGSSRYIIHTDNNNNNVGSATIATSSRIANGRSGKSLFGKSSSIIDRGKKRFEISKHDTASVIDNEDGDCARPGLFRHPKLCNKFYVCHWDEWKQKFSRHVFNCPIHLTFDSTAGACNWPSKGPACQDDNLLV
ncbi:uncharacterized protein LOC127286862 isoform X2 [Leptopilina boulardi]|uniref:uncharacterized protein LOC127286862 isoform X2 n=1 Tax=Leptopilina boulardi TaxID=63433 RepID=UPI0021F56958|nr:uncharacterized protein LOC127286862 isoform X2 [Leptopilina boulardi]